MYSIVSFYICMQNRIKIFHPIYCKRANSGIPGMYAFTRPTVQAQFKLYMVQ